jgi:hypothetical protein
MGKVSIARYAGDESRHKGGHGRSRYTPRDHRKAAIVVLDRVLVGDLKSTCLRQEMDSRIADVKPF